MKLYKWLVPAVLIAGCVLPGCKKDEETSYEYLDGRLSLSMPGYVNPGFTKTFMIDTLMTLSRPDGGAIGYYFTDPDTGVADTLVTADGVIHSHYYTVTVPDKIKTLTLRLNAFLDEEAEYYSSSASATFTPSLMTPRKMRRASRRCIISPRVSPHTAPRAVMQALTISLEYRSA